MKIAPLPLDEVARLASLRRAKILDTPPSAAFDDIARLAAAICGTPIALVSLIDEDRQWFKARVGVDIQETPRDIAFCSHAILGRTTLQVEDTHEDARFADNPFVTGLGDVRFYAGAPLVDADDRAYGTLCVIDHEPRALTDAQKDALAALARQVMAQISLLEQSEEQQRLLDELRRESARLAEAQAVAKVGSWEMDLQTNTLTWSDENYRIFEIEKSAFSQSYEAFLARVHPDDRAFVHRAYTDSLESRVPYALDHRVVLPEGREKIVHERCQTFYDETGKPTRSMGTSQDVTDRRRAEAALHESRQTLRAVLDTVPQRVFWKDCDSVYLGCNRAFANDMGFDDPAEVVGKTDFDATWMDHAEVYRADDRAVVTTGSSKLGHEEPILRPEGTGWVITSKLPLRAPDGTVTGLIGTYEDITARKQTEARLAQQAALLDQAQDAIHVRDLDHRVTYWNKSAERLYELAFDASAGRSAREHVFADDQVAYDAAMSVLLANGEWIGELQATTPSGAKLTINARWTLVADERGTPRAVLSIETDITEHKRLARQLIHAQRLESVGTLAAGMAHEINNPLAYVIGNIEVCREWLAVAIADLRAAGDGAGQPDFARLLATLVDLDEPLRDANDGAQRVSRLVLDIKSMARQGDTTAAACDLQRAIEVAVKMTASSVRHSSRVRTILAETPPVQATDGALVQVITNLLINAAQAIGDGNADANEITVATYTDADGWACLEVRDTGPGIAVDALPRVFDPFFTTKRAGAGMGLGLSTSHSIVAGFGGRLSAENYPAGGALFRMQLPPVSRIVLASPAASLRVPARRARVLVVDDEPSVAAAIERMLRGHHDVRAVTEGRAALALLGAGEAYDLILCDLMMPTISGVDLYRATAAISAEQASRFVFMTGGAFTTASQEFLAQVECVHITKPFSVERIRSLVAKSVEARAVIS